MKTKLIFRQPQNDLQNPVTTHTSQISVPVLWNGNRLLELEKITLENAVIILKNTCLFDSLFSIFVSASMYNNRFYESLLSGTDDRKETTESIFFSMIKNVIKVGINHETYVNRGNLMINYFNAPILSGRVTAIECSTELTNLYNSLSESRPSLSTVYRCSNDSGHNLIVQQTTIEVQLNVLINEENFQKFFLDQLYSKEIPCLCCENLFSTEPNYGMLFSLSSKIFEVLSILKEKIIDQNFSGDIVCFVAVNSYKKVALGEIPKILNGKSDQEVFVIFGLVNCYEAEVQEKHANGHFTAFCYQMNTWFECDDNKLKSTPCFENYMVNPMAIFYFKLQALEMSMENLALGNSCKLEKCVESNASNNISFHFQNTQCNYSRLEINNTKK